MASPRRARRPRLAGAFGLAAAAAVLVAGCATVPTVGQPRAVTGETGQVPQFVQPIPPVPQPGWSPADIVQGFLAASASFAHNHAAAQLFLSPSARRSFQPRTWPVTVVSGQLDVQTTPLGPSAKGGTDVIAVKLHGQQIAAISDIGQYINSPGSRTYTFTLVKTANQWRINSLQPAALLLTQADFEDVYQPRNLYLWSPTHQFLVPEPVFAPQQDSYPAAAANLVNALLGTRQDRTTWLTGAAQTSFPARTYLIGKKVTITGSTATVNLGGAAARASQGRLQEMADQLVATLTSTSYAQPPIVRHVQLKVNGQQLRVSGQARDGGVPPAAIAGLVPGVAAGGGPLYYLAANHAISAWSGSASRTVRNPAGHDQVAFSQIAVSPGPTPETQLVAGTVPDGRGCGVYDGPLVDISALALHVLPSPRAGPCTSVSWDSSDTLWAVTAHGVWALPQDGRQFVPVGLPALPGGILATYHVLSLRVAPDGVRVAMLVQAQGTASTQVVMAAITRAGSGLMLGPTVAVGPTLSDPVALNWLDPDHLVVLARSQLYSVPVNGGAAVAVDPAPAGADSVTAAGPGRIAVAGGGQIWTSSGPAQVMQLAVRGGSPTYQG